MISSSPHNIPNTEAYLGSESSAIRLRASSKSFPPAVQNSSSFEGGYFSEDKIDLNKPTSSDLDSSDSSSMTASSPFATINWARRCFNRSRRSGAYSKQIIPCPRLAIDSLAYSFTEKCDRMSKFTQTSSNFCIICRNR